MNYVKKSFFCICIAVSLLLMQIAVFAENIDINKILLSVNNTYTVSYDKAEAGRTYSIAVVSDTFYADADAVITEDNLLYATQIKAESETITKDIYMPNIGNNIYTAVLGDSIGSDLKVIGYLTEKVIISVTGVKVDYTNKTIKRGTQTTLVSTIYPYNATNTGVSWTSDKPDVAVVDNNGVVTGLADGVANITVTTDDGKFTDVCEITVNADGIDRTKPLIEVSSVSGMPDDYVKVDIELKNNFGLTDLDLNISYDKQALYLDKSVESNVFENYSKSTISKMPYTISCSSDNINDKSGIVTSLYFYVEDGVVEGQKYPITVTVTKAKKADENINIPVIDNGGTFTCERITPSIIPVSGIEVLPSEKTIYIGENFNMSAKILPENASDTTVQWSINNTEVATVDENGVVLGLKEGTVTVTATTNGSDSDGKQLKGRCRLTVVEAPPMPISVTGVKLSSSSVILTKGDATYLIAAVLPENADNKNVTWMSDNDLIATVDSNGFVRAISEGSTKVTVKTEDGEFIASCLVTVEPIPEPEPDPDLNPEPNVDTVIAVGTVSGVPGDTVNVPVVISNNTGIEAIQMELTYSEGLKLTGVLAGTALSEHTFTPSGTYDVYPFNLMWDGTSNSISNGTMLTLIFRIDDEATEGQYNINLQYKEGKIYNHDMENINPSIVQGVVNVSDYIPGDINGDHDVTVKDVTFLRRYIVKGYDITVVEKALDVNRDGEIDVKDATTLSRYITGGYGIELH